LAAAASSASALPAMAARRLGQCPAVRSDRSTMPPSTAAPNLCAPAWRKLTNRMAARLGLSEQLCEALGEPDTLDRRGPGERAAGGLDRLLTRQALGHGDRASNPIEKRGIDHGLQFGRKARESGATQDDHVGAILAD